jgi:exonuclease SbcC
MVAARESLSLHQVACQRMEGDIDRVAQKINELKRQLIDDEGECATLQEEVSKILDDFGVKLKGGQDPDELIRSLKQRKQAFEDAMNRKRELERDTGLLSRDIENGRMRLDEDQKTVDSLSQNIREKEEASSGLSKERIGLYGTKDPDLEEKRIAETVAAVEREFLKSSESQKDSESRVSSLRDQIGSVTGKFKELRESLERMEKAFAKRIREAGFSDENDFITMRISRDEFESLERMEKELLFEEKDISTRLKETLRNLEEEHVRAVTERQIPELQVEIAACDEAIADLNSTLGRIRQKLEDHEKLAAQQKDLLQALERQEIECLRWEKLHDLIGSADGKRFRVFAQGLTFDRLIAHANRNLQKMSDRYLLVRKENSSLDLDIIDGYQAGEIRSTKNLSGGESFIVSLALALGLSGMASRNVRIDSLFLDEGFGTLDSDTLEVALGTLSTLQQEGKMIGIISHVPALKERIPTKITVIKKAGGRSRIIGPGCTSTSMQ